MDNLHIPVAISGLVPPVCDAEAGQGDRDLAIAAVYSSSGSDSWGDPQPEQEVADPLVKHGFSVGKFRTAIAELCSAIRSALDDERGTAEDSLRRAGEILRDMGDVAAPVQTQSRGGLAPWQVRKVTSYVDANLDQTIRNEDLAAIVRLNASHFGRAFRNSFGEPPHEYVIRRRVERAQGLMLSTTAPLSSIALDCGLADQAHLSRLFRRVVGETPRAWRRARLGEPVEAT
jgi:AraC-like DNA-binding protein